MANNSLNRASWSSRWGFIISATGAAVGLGNIWRFPYMAGDNGGSAFVLLYLFFVLIMGLPIMMSEFLIGRRGRQNPVTSLTNLAIVEKGSKHWGWLGWWGAFALILVLSFYSVVSGWAIAYIYRAFSGEFTGMNDQQVTQVWTNFLASPGQMIFWHAVFMFLTMWVVARGVQEGLEKACRIMMPLLYVILIVLAGYAATTGSFAEGVRFLFAPDFHKITGSVIIAAMGHAFFTLALGAGAMLVYGSYVSKQVSIGSSVIIIAVLDVLVAILAGLAIFPIVFANHLPPQGGPGLMFVTLPIAFAKISGGQFIGGLFFVLLLFAAWTSSINMAEPLVIILTEKYGMRRGTAAILIGIVAWIIGLGSVFSFNVWQNVKFFGQWTVFDLSTNIPTNIILPLGGFFFALFAGWIMSQRATEEELALKSKGIYSCWRFLIRYIAPLSILVVFIASVI